MLGLPLGAWGSLVGLVIVLGIALTWWRLSR